MVYEYTAINIKGKIVKGVSDANDELELHRLLRMSGFFLLDLSKEKKFKINLINQIDVNEISIISRQLSVLLKSGMQLNYAINVCMHGCKRRRYKKSLNDAYYGVLKGEKLSLCLKRYISIYPAFFIDMVEIGEETGTLTDIFSNLSAYYYKEKRIQDKIKTALTYPLLLAVCTIAVMLMIITKIMPEFIDMLKSVGGEVPQTTKIFLMFGGFLKDNFFMIIFAMLIAVLIVKYYVQSTRGKLLLSLFKLKFPLVSRIYKNISQLRLMNSMYILLSTGFNPIKSLEISSNIFNNEILKNKMKLAVEDIRKGKSLSQAIEDMNILSVDFISMVRVGEETGDVKDTIKEIIESNEEGLEERINRIIKLLEPTAVAIIAAIILFVIFSALLPVINIMDSFGGQL